MSNQNSNSFPRLHRYPNWQYLARGSNWQTTSISVFRLTEISMTPKLNTVQQRQVTRVVKGAIAAGLEVTTVRIDKDGSIVLYSGSREREAREEPRLPINLNEWDEVLKK